MTDGLIWLLIDDDPEDREIFAYALESAGAAIRLLEFASGEAALEQLERLSDSELPHLLFLDLNMPRMSGKECLARLKASERLRNIPVIVYTTSSSPRDARELLDMGARDFLTKPSDIAFLVGVLKSVIRQQETVSI